MNTPSGPVAAVRHATTRQACGWYGLTMKELRRFVEDHADVDDDACLIAVTEQGTAELRGVGFFSMG